MNIKQAFNQLLQGKNVVLEMKYFDHCKKIAFRSEYFGSEQRKIAFKHKVECAKNDFKTTFIVSNKKRCTFNFVNGGVFLPD